MSEQSQIQFYQSYWVKNDTAQFVSHTSQKNNLSLLIIASSSKLEPFSTIFRFFNFFLKNTQVACSIAGNVISGSKLITRSHVQSATLQKQSMRIQTTGQDLDLVRTSRITASRLTRFFTCNQRLSSTVLSSRAHFFQQRCTK